MSSSLGQFLMKIRGSVFSCLYNTGCLRAMAWLLSRKTIYIVLSYHGVSDKPHPLFTSARLFEKHMRFISEWGSCATLGELAEFLSKGTCPQGSRLRFVITFDDGYANVVRNAVPTLRKYGFKGIVYITPAWIDARATPWWFQLAGDRPESNTIRHSLLENKYCDEADLGTPGDEKVPIKLIDKLLEKIPQEAFGDWWQGIAAGNAPTLNECCSEARLATWEELNSASDTVSFGSHTYSHSILGLCRDRDFARREINLAKNTAESKLGKACPHFAYPRGRKGDYNPHTRDCVVAAGHLTAATMREGVVRRGEDPFQIPRLSVGETPVAELAACIVGIRAIWDNSVVWLRSKLERLSKPWTGEDKK